MRLGRLFGRKPREGEDRSSEADVTPAPPEPTARPAPSESSEPPGTPAGGERDPGAGISPDRLDDALRRLRDQNPALDEEPPV